MEHETVFPVESPIVWPCTYLSGAKSVHEGTWRDARNAVINLLHLEPTPRVLGCLPGFVFLSPVFLLLIPEHL